MMGNSANVPIEQSIFRHPIPERANSNDSSSLDGMAMDKRLSGDVSGNYSVDRHGADVIVQALDSMRKPMVSENLLSIDDIKVDFTPSMIDRNPLK